MFKIKTLTVKNFMSVGNQTQAVDFDKNLLTLVLGENLDLGGDDAGSRNGTGKTTIINALSYALYGEALTKIRRENLINKTNGKGMLVTVEFETNGQNYRIERGRKPNVLKFYREDIDVTADDVDESQGDSRKTQEDIQRLLNMSHTMFKHLVALNTYTEPFLSLKANDQREIIEQLLGITILSEKAERLKEEQKKVRDAISEEEATIKGIETANKKVQESIDNLEIKSKAWDASQAEEIARTTKAISHLITVDIEAEIQAHKDKKEWQKQDTEQTNLNKEKASLESSLLRADRTHSKYEQELKDIASKKCFTCGQELHDEAHEKILAEKQNDVTESQTYIDGITLQLKEVQDKLDAIGDINGCPKTFYDSSEEAYNHKNNLASLEERKVEKEAEINPYTEQMDELRDQALQEINWDNINSLTEMKDHMDFLYKLLTSKDSFIRKRIIDQNLAFLNKRLQFYLDRTGLPHQVVFQNDLTVEITELGRDLDFDNLSRGERNRLILSMSWAFRDVWESLYQSINLLFIDELVDNGLDAAGVESALSVLKKMSRERHKNIYLISHKDELSSRVNNILKVIKDNGFTSYSNDTEVNSA
jgi:DNA repair exonuclease SbcCD ATPase subunit